MVAKKRGRSGGSQEQTLQADAQAEYFRALAHDVRAPVAALHLELREMARLLARDGHSYDLRRCELAIGQIDYLLSNMSFVSRHGPLGAVDTPPPQRVAMNKILSTARLLNKQLAEISGKRLLVATSRLSAVTIPELLQSILQNLIGNAIKHSSGARIRVGCRRRGEALVLSVWDNGGGLDLGQRTALLAANAAVPVKEAAIQSLKSESWRAGLHIIAGWVRVLGGSIELPDMPIHCGFKIKVVIPAKVRREPIEVVRPIEAYVGNSEAPLRGKLIAVLDDDPEAASISEASFASLGAEVFVRHDPDRFVWALEKRKSRGDTPPDLLCLDFFLDSGTVVPVWERLLEIYDASPPPAILLSGADWQAAMAKITEWMPLVQKPLRETHVTAIVGALTQRDERSFARRYSAIAMAAQIDSDAR